MNLCKSGFLLVSYSFWLKDGSKISTNPETDEQHSIYCTISLFFPLIVFHFTVPLRLRQVGILSQFIKGEMTHSLSSKKSSICVCLCVCDTVNHNMQLAGKCVFLQLGFNAERQPSAGLESHTLLGCLFLCVCI